MKGKLLVLPLTVLLLAALHAAPGQQPRAWRVSDQPILSIGSRDAEGPGLFGTITGAVRLSSGVVVVADEASLELRFFSAAGRHLKTSGGKGSGPGEFRTMHPIQRCAGDSIYVYDSTLFRISVFSPAGVLLRTTDLRKWVPDGLPPYDFWCNDAGILAFVHRSAAPPPGEGPYRPNVQISLVGSNDSVVPLGTFAATERYFQSPNSSLRNLGKVTSVAIGSRVLYVGTGEAYEVSRFSLRGERLAALREARPTAPVTNEQVNAYIKGLVARASKRVEPSRYQAYLRGLQWPKAYPAYASVKVDALDNLWIEDYPVPGAAVRNWTVYSQSGAKTAVLSLPRGFRLMEAGRDYVLGVWRDDFEVDYVRVYRLLK